MWGCRPGQRTLTACLMVKENSRIKLHIYRDGEGRGYTAASVGGPASLIESTGGPSAMRTLETAQPCSTCDTVLHRWRRDQALDVRLRSRTPDCPLPVRQLHLPLHNGASLRAASWRVKSGRSASWSAPLGSCLCWSGPLRASGPIFLGAKRVAIAGSVIFAVASILYVPALEVWAIVPVRMLQGVGMAMTPVATVTVVVNLAPLRRRAEALSNHGNSIALSALYSPVVGFWLISNHGFELGFLYTAACAGVAAFLALWMSAARTRVAVSKDPSHKAPLIAPGALFPTAVFVSYTLTTAPVSTFLPLLAETRGLGNPGLYFTVNSLTTMATMLFAGRAADRLGRPALIIPGLLSAGTAMFLLLGAHHQVVFLGAAVFRRGRVRNDPAGHAVVHGGPGPSSPAQLGAGDAPVGLGHRRGRGRFVAGPGGGCAHRGVDLRNRRRRRPDRSGRLRHGIIQKPSYSRPQGHIADPEEPRSPQSILLHKCLPIRRLMRS